MNKTKVNTSLNYTVINDEINQATQINFQLEDNFILSEGSILADKYKIIKPLNIMTGEANLYICEYEKQWFIAKIYRRKQAIKPEILRSLKEIESPYISKLYDYGIYKEMPFEILPYYKNGSLQGKKFTLDELKRIVIPCINEALNILHSNDIIHKDLKPSNIMISDDMKSVSLIDFGISSMVEDGNTVLVTKTGMTPEYSAPETFRSLFLAESDYYSFGITIYELFSGHTPYTNMNAEEIAQFTAIQKIPFSKEMPQELKELITAMTYYDITKRNELNNPNRRWTYVEVNNWLKNKKQVIPGEGSDFGVGKTIPAYTFLGEPYYSVSSLVTALANNWNDGKKQLYRGLLSGFFKNFNPEIAGFCLDAEEEANGSKGKDDLIFWNLLYKIYPYLNEFYWMGQTYESLPALGRDMLERLWNQDNSNYNYWDSILNNKLLSCYLLNIKSKNVELAEAVSALESVHNVIQQNSREKIMNYYSMAYLLSGQRLFAIGDKKLKSVSELTSYMKELLDSSYEELEKFCHSMIDYDDILDVQLESWLIALGKRKELETWRNNLNI